MTMLLPSTLHQGTKHAARADVRSAALHGYEETEKVFSLPDYGWLLRRSWKKIALAVVLCTGVVAAITFQLAPVYEATAKIAVDLKTPSAVMGDASVVGASGTDADQFFNTELQVLQSDAVLRPVAKQFQLQSAVNRRKVPAGMDPLEAPVTLGNLSVSHPANSFLINVSYRSRDTSEAAAIANAVAHSYVRHSMEMRVHSSMEESAFMESQLGTLRKNMDDSGAALAVYEKQLGVINAEEKTSILAARLLQLNTQLTDAQNERVKKQVDYRAMQTGELAALQVSPQATALAKMEESVQMAQDKMIAAKTVYGMNYPEYKRAANQLTEVTRQYTAMQAQIGKRIEMEYHEASNREGMLRSALLQAKNESDTLNAHSQEYQELKRQAEVNKTLYSELYRKVKEAGINGAFKGSSIRIADEARPQMYPVFPNKPVFIAIAFMFSLFASAIVTILANLFDKSLRDPEQAWRTIGTEVLGILPKVRRFSSVPQFAPVYGKALRKAPKHWFCSTEFYQEAIYTLHSTLLLGRRHHPLRSILVTSAESGEGKSACVAYLAVAHAKQGYRTLLIDADVRCPTQQRNFTLRDGLSLNDAFLTNKTLGQVKRQAVGLETLDVVTGTSTDGVYDWVGKVVGKLMLEAKDEYDLILIDAPPILCFSEPLQLACLTDGVLIVSKAGQTTGQAVLGVLATLQRLGVSILGLVLNQVQPDMSPMYKTYHSYYRNKDRMALKSA